MHANLKDNLEGQAHLPSTSNYFVGNNRAKWLHNVPQYAQVRYRDVYPGIDWLYHGHGGQLEYDFVVAPRANPAEIQLSMDAADESVVANVNQNGDLELAVDGEPMLLHAPRLYQGKNCVEGSDGEFDPKNDGCEFVPGGTFTLQKREHDIVVGFDLPPYDLSQTLIIDPVLSFSTFLGDSLGASTNGVAVDAAGNIYVVGTGVAGFPVTPGAYQTTAPGGGDVVIFKMSSDGSRLIYSTFLGGSSGEAPTGIAIDASGNAYVTGVTASSDFPTVNQIGPVPQMVNAFVSKLSADGSSLLYSTLIGGNHEGSSKSIAVNAAGEAVIAGRTYSTTYPVTPGVIEPTQNTNGNESGFLTKISADGKSYVFSTYLGANSGAEALGVGFDPSGSVYVTGFTNPNFPVTPGAFQTTCVTVSCAFAVKLNSTGTSLNYSSYISGSMGRAIAVNAAGNAYVTGVTYPYQPFPTTPGVFQPQAPGSEDAFVTEFSADGSSVVFSTFLGGQNDEMGEAIALDTAGNVYVVGETSSIDFPTQAPIQPNYAGDGDTFLSELNSSGSQLLFSTYLGGTYTEYAAGVAADTIGNMYFVGTSTSTDFPIVNAIQPGLTGFGDAVILKVTNQADFAITASPPVAAISAGQTASYTLTITPENGFNQNVTLSCAGAPAGSTCSVSPTSVNVSGGPGTATVSVRTTAAALRSQATTGAHRGKVSFAFASLFAIFLAAPFGTKKKDLGAKVLTCTVLIGLLILANGCGGGSAGGGGSGSPTPPGEYALSVTASGGSLNHPAQLGLIVN